MPTRFVIARVDKWQKSVKIVRCKRESNSHLSDLYSYKCLSKYYIFNKSTLQNHIIDTYRKREKSYNNKIGVISVLM